MNKLLIAAMLFVGTVQAHAELTVKSPQPQSPIVFKVVSTSTNGVGQTTLNDGKTNRVLISFYSASCTFQIYTSAGAHVGSQEEGIKVCKEVRAAVLTASESTPVTVTIDRETMKIIDFTVAEGVDHMAQAPSTPNAG